MSAAARLKLVQACSYTQDIEFSSHLPPSTSSFLLTYRPTHRVFFSPTALHIEFSSHLPPYTSSFRLTYRPTHRVFVSPTALRIEFSSHLPPYTSCFRLTYRPTHRNQHPETDDRETVTALGRIRIHNLSIRILAF